MGGVTSSMPTPTIFVQRGGGTAFWLVACDVWAGGRRMTDKPKPLKGFLQKRGPKEYHGWKRRWFVLENNILTYYKVRRALHDRAGLFLACRAFFCRHRLLTATSVSQDQNDTEPVAAMHLGELFVRLLCCQAHSRRRRKRHESAPQLGRGPQEAGAVFVCAGYQVGVFVVCPGDSRCLTLFQGYAVSRLVASS
jgi:hypothetical protein